MTLPVPVNASSTSSPLRCSSSNIYFAAELLLPYLECGGRIDALILRAAMETAFGASDAAGAWDWKQAYDACEVATVLFLRKYGERLFRKNLTPNARLMVIKKIVALLPTQTRRSDESQKLQQFSTPITLGLAALTAAAITPDDVVLEPSAGTGLLAILAQMTGAGGLMRVRLRSERSRTTLANSPRDRNRSSSGRENHSDDTRPTRSPRVISTL